MNQAIPNTPGAQIIFVTGGCRSGKSAFAEQLALKNQGTKVYIATAPCLDQEMQQRIQSHKQRRQSQNWVTVEETTNLLHAFIHKSAACWLLDSITVWVGNIQYETPQLCTEDQIKTIVHELHSYWQTLAPTTQIIIVSDEVGLGIVPADPLTRQYRDVLGTCNQQLAAIANQVFFVVSGIPMQIK
jgi:adenosylcobinamide kinase / adenosylcobinamide-phosphate guanylyltransferase